MFINLENGKLKLYDLRLYKRLDDVKYKLIFESPHEHKTEETTNLGYYDGKIINGKDMIKFINFTNTGRKVEYNDFFSNPESIYRYDYEIYHLTDIYLMINELQSSNYSELERLNEYIEGSIKNNDQLIFDKYKKKILGNIKLVELMDRDSKELDLFYQMLLQSSKGEYKQKVKNLPEYLNIHELRLDNIPKIIKR